MEIPSSPTLPSLSRKTSNSSFKSTTSSTEHYESLVPTRSNTTSPLEETFVPVPGISAYGDGTDGNGDVRGGGGVRLKVDSMTGCGGITWASGEILAKYLAYKHGLDPSYLLNRKILELGSGTGLVGIAVGMLQPHTKVWVSDQAQIINLMNRNIALNLPDQSEDTEYGVQALELNWGDPIPEEIIQGDIDMILAADCVYSEAAFPLLVKTLCDLVPSRSGSESKEIEVLFCWKKRRKADRHFFTMLHKHFTSIPIDDDRPGEKDRYSREGISLLRLIRKS